jgi:hypothetical protein
VAQRLSSEKELLRPQEEALRPQEEALRPQEEVLRPQEEALRPQEEALRPQEEVLRPQEEALRPQEEALRPQEEVFCAIAPLTSVKILNFQPKPIKSRRPKNPSISKMPGFCRWRLIMPAEVDRQFNYAQWRRHGPTD